MKNEEDPPKVEHSGEPVSPVTQVIVDSHGISRNLKGQFVAKQEADKAEETEIAVLTSQVQDQADMISVLRQQQGLMQKQMESLENNVLETQQIVQEHQVTTSTIIPALTKMMGRKCVPR